MTPTTRSTSSSGETVETIPCVTVPTATAPTSCEAATPFTTMSRSVMMPARAPSSEVTGSAPTRGRA
ncbi:hypothetical protein BJF82_14310 [Kytococcus sp. CUA-901]|nr:hypothetical protein BJF82_14310 [Kytococcus sp. CUA-901]